MKEITSAMRIWILVLIITYLFLGLSSIFAQGFLTNLYGTEAFEPGFLRVSGAMELGFAFMLYRAHAIKDWNTVKPMIETLLVTMLLLIFVGMLNWFTLGLYSTQAYITWSISLTFFFVVTLIFYLKQR